MKARKIKRVKAKDIYTVKNSTGAQLLGLAEPFSSAPFRGADYQFYCEGGPGGKEAFYHIMACAPYAAKKFLDAVMQGAEYRWVDEYGHMQQAIRLHGSNMRITGPTLEKVLKHEYTEDEARWEIGEPMLSEIKRFLDPTYRSFKVVEGGGGKVEKPKREKKERKPRPSRDGLVSVADIAKEMEINPREARGALRAMKAEKPAEGWAWPKDKVEEIKKIIKKGLK